MDAKCMYLSVFLARTRISAEEPCGSADGALQHPV